MSEPDDQPAPEVEAAAPEVAAEEAAAAKKPPRKLRLAALIIIPSLVVLVVIGVWLFGDGFLRGQIRSAIEDAGLDPGDTVIEASLLGGSAALKQAELVARHEAEQRSIYRSPETVIDVAVLDSAAAGAPIIQRIAAREVEVDLRRFADGTVPGTEPEDEVTEDGEEPEEAPPRDFVELYRRWRDRYRKAKEWMPEGGDDEEVAVGDQPSRPAEGWNNAVRYFPKPDPEAGGSPFPRTLIRELDISGERIVLPDSTGEAPSPLDVTGFSLTGSNVTTQIAEGETMVLDAEYQTAGAGVGSLAYQAHVTDGRLNWAWSDIPLPTVADPAVSGDRITDYGPKGVGNLALDAAWEGDVLTGSIVLELIDLRLKPTPEGGAEAKEVAKGLDELHELHAKLDAEGPLVIRWELTLGGSPGEPRITDLGLASFQAALKDAAKQLKEAAAAKAKQLAGEAKDDALEEGKGLIEDVKSGKDVEASAKERLKNLEESGTGDKLKGLFGK